MGGVVLVFGGLTADVVTAHIHRTSRPRTRAASESLEQRALLSVAIHLRLKVPKRIAAGDYTLRASFTPAAGDDTDTLNNTVTVPLHVA